MEDLRYPIGKFVYDGNGTPEKRAAWIRDVAELPHRLRQAVAGLSPTQLDTPYRDGGWTARQLVHHIADSHMNAFTRFKLALTEDTPQIKPYNQDAWAVQADVLTVGIEPSLSLLDGLHARFTALLASLTPADLQRTFFHPENGPVTLERTLQTYSWHSRHHVAHITALRARKGW